MNAARKVRNQNSPRRVAIRYGQKPNEEDGNVLRVDFTDGAEDKEDMDAWETRKRTHAPLARFLGLQRETGT